METLNYIYKFLFSFGVIYCLVSFLLGGLFEIGHLGHIDGHFDSHVGGDGHSDGCADGQGEGNTGGGSFWAVSPLKPIVIVSFLTVFGGVGIMGTQFLKWTSILILLLALFSALFISFGLYKFIVVPLYLSQHTTAVSQEKLIGIIAQVATPILKEGFGKISYSVNEIRYTAPAKHLEGEEVEQGAKVLICKIEDGVFYVTKFTEV